MTYRTLRGSLALSLILLGTGCYHYHIMPDRVPVSTDPRSETRVAFLWGLVQPNDIVPPNCPRTVPLAQVTASTNLGFVFIGALTLGIVLPQDIEWQCAKLPQGAPVL
jgi:hypothetical protein